MDPACLPTGGAEHDGAVAGGQGFGVAVLLLALGIGVALMPHNSTADFGLRELGHLLGFAGLSVGVGSLLVQDNRRMRARQLLACAAGLAAVWLANRLGQLSAALAILIGYGTCLLAALVVLGGGKLQGVARRWPLLVTLGFCLVVSLAWELLHQPFVAVYSAGPRGHIQWAQVISDISGTLVGAACLCWLWRNSRWPTLLSVQRMLNA
jgi:hypothetical protein